MIARLGQAPLAPASPPRLVRKKTGEIVKLSLKLSALGRTVQSLPTTPTYKLVHFNNKSFMDIKYFDENESPTAISALPSPTERPDRESLWFFGPESDTESEDEELTDWTLCLVNFSERYDYSQRLASSPAVFLERVMLNGDRTFLKGNIATKNIAFEKHVLLKYSLNNWRIVSEVKAQYTPDSPRLLRKAGYDRFTFSIPVKELVQGLKGTREVSFVCCVRYETNGQVYWDNNHTKNYVMVLGCGNSNSPKKRLGQYLSRQLNRSQKEFVGQIQRSLSKISFNDEDSTSESGQRYSRYLDSGDSYFPPFETTFDILKDDLGDSLVDFKYTLDLTKDPGPSSREKKESKSLFKDNFAHVAPTMLDLKLGSARPSFESKSYKELVENYCFYEG